ncbi:MAG: trigger factor, partial [Lysobacterales bacterium]
MQISLENTGTLERKLTVTLPASRLEDEIKSRLQKLGREVRLNGFRPGKVPMSVISKRFGAQVRDEVFEELVRDSFGEALRKEKLRPAMSPRITPVSDAGQDQLAFTAEFEVMPELEAIDVSALSIARTEAEVQDVDIDNMIDTLRQQRKSWNRVERPAAEADLVLFEHSAQAGDVRFPVEGIERAGTVIGSAALPTEFEAALVGMSEGQDKTFDIDFPETWPQPELTGKNATVTVTVTQVKEGALPEVDTDFIESFGIENGDVDQFRRDIRANLDRELGSALGARLKDEV